MPPTSVRFTGMLVLTTALALSAAACGGSGDKAAACQKLQSTIQDASQKGMTQVSDPNGLAQTYANAATTMRQEGKDSGDDAVEKAANHAATALENLGNQVKSIAAGGSTMPQMPDTSDLINAGKELKSACG